MSKKPKLREKYAYKVAKGLYTTFSTYEDACRNAFFWGRQPTALLGKLSEGDIFILLSKKNMGKEGQFLEIIAPDGTICWFCLRERASIRLISRSR